MASDSNPVRVTISQPADGTDGLNPANVVVSGSNNLDDAFCRKAVARDIFGREFPGTIRQRPDSPAWSAVFSDLPAGKWLVVYVEFQRPGYDDIGSAVISIRCVDHTSPPPQPAKFPTRKSTTSKQKRKPARKTGKLKR